MPTVTDKYTLDNFEDLYTDQNYVENIFMHLKDGNVGKLIGFYNDLIEYLKILRKQLNNTREEIDELKKK